MKITFFLVALSFATSAFSDDSFQHITLKGKWLVEENGQVMQHPQTSGLKLWRGKLLAISDRSAHEFQQKQLHIIETTTATLAEKSLVMSLSDNVINSCFGQYLAGKPDFEALAVDPNNDNVFIVVTEDARQGEQLSLACQQRFKHTGSTQYPSLLVRLELNQDNSLSITNVRPIQFKATYNIGNFPNDGIEGLAFGLNSILYLGLEKDRKGSARIFSTQITKNFWQSDDFIAVVDAKLLLPQFEKGRHPINGMDYLPVENHPGYLVAAARNDNQLWIIDLAKRKPMTIISMEFLAPVDSNDVNCSEWELINNTSLEGVAVTQEQIWLINDPWTEHYMDNVKCESNRDKYKQLAPLLFSLPISAHWLQ